MENATLDTWNTVARPVRSGYSPAHVQLHCVRNKPWQRFRLMLKGKTTAEKLHLLRCWYDGKLADCGLMTRWEREVQVGNYLGALRRGGQLDMNNRIKRFR